MVLDIEAARVGSKVERVLSGERPDVEVSMCVFIGSRSTRAVCEVSLSGHRGIQSRHDTQYVRYSSDQPTDNIERYIWYTVHILIQQPQ